MANETSKYRNEAIALIGGGLSYRAAAATLKLKYGRPVAAYSTICSWYRQHTSPGNKKQSVA